MEHHAKTLCTLGFCFCKKGFGLSQCSVPKIIDTLAHDFPEFENRSAHEFGVWRRLVDKIQFFKSKAAKEKDARKLQNVFNRNGEVKELLLKVVEFSRGRDHEPNQSPHSQVSSVAMSQTDVEPEEIRCTIQSAEKRNDMELRTSKKVPLQVKPTEKDQQNDKDPHGLRNIALKLAATYFKLVTQYAHLLCWLCDKLLYPNGTKKGKISNQTQAQILSLDKNLDCDMFGDPCVLCHRCHKANKDGKVTPQCKFNNMALDPCPVELTDLSEIELDMIAQIKPFMKIFYLAKGTGQFGLKGQAVYFPQSVDEVHEQLPLASTDMDLIIVNETLEKVDKRRHFLIRPEKVRAALEWLKTNNPLYKDVTIVDKNLDSIELDTFVAPMNELPDDAPNLSNPQGNFGYSYLNEASPDEGSILRGTFSHENSMFPVEIRGKFGAFSSAAALAYASIQPPITWTRITLDEILVLGSSYCKAQNSRNPPEEKYQSMETLAVTGKIQIFENLELEISLDTTEPIQGNLNNVKYRGKYNNLVNSIEMFLKSKNNYAIISVLDSDVALLSHENFVYYYDPGSRGLKGQSSKRQTGTACVMRFSLDKAPVKISKLIHRNFQSTSKNTKDKKVTDIKNALNIPFTMNIVNINKICPVEKTTEEYEDDGEPPNKRQKLQDKVHAPVGNPVSDSLFHNIEHCAPSLTEFKNHAVEFSFHRKTGAPLKSSKEKHIEELSFVKEFPFGRGGRFEERKIKQSPLDYYQQRVMSSDPRFSTPKYIFHALCEVESYQIMQKIAVCCDMKKQVSNGDDDVAGNIHLVMKGIRGTPSYWLDYQSNVISMVKQFGGCSLFLTFSYNDLNSFDSINAMYKRKFGFDIPDIDPDSLTYSEKRELLNEDPLTAARHFHYRVQQIFNIIKKHGEEIFGFEVTEYTWRIEYQGRGAGHVHSLIFLKDAPKFGTKEFVEWVDRIATCSTSTWQRDLVLKYQTHRHSSTCFKGKSCSCRFSFPRPTAAQTRVFDDDEVQLKHGRFYELKRSQEEIFINNYNPVLLEMLQCNMDLQIVTNKFSVAYYVTKYMSKAEPEGVRKELQKVLQSALEASSVNLRDKLMKQAFKIMRQREISAQEVVARLCHLLLHYSTRTTVFVPVFKMENRTRMINRLTINDPNPKFCENIIEKYMKRPKMFEHLCLYEFAAEFEVVVPEKFKVVDSHNDQEIEGDNADDNYDSPREKYRLLNSTTFIQKRKKVAIVKTPNFNPASDSENYYHSLILMYLPFREENFLNNFESSLQAFRHHHPNLRKQSDNPIIQFEFSNELDRCIIKMTDFENCEDDNSNNNISVSDDYFEDESDERKIDPFPKQTETITAESLIKQIKSLGSEQRAVFDLRRVNNQKVPAAPIRLAVSGSGGVGKSTTIHAIKNYLQMTTTGKTLVIGGPTGVSSKNIGGQTIHKLFCLPVEKNGVPVYKPLKNKQLERLRHLYKDLQLIIIDEYSLISYEVLRIIHLRLQEIFKNDGLFGNKSIIFFGDPLQIPPVRGHKIFQQPPVFGAEPHLWHQFQYIELTQTHRQKSDDPLLPFLLRLRKGETNEDDIKLLMSLLLDPSKPDYKEKMAYFEDALRIFPTKKLVQAYNKKRTEEMSKKTTIFNINAIDSYADSIDSSKRPKPSEIPKDDRKCGGIPAALAIGIGIPVMLLVNLDTDAGLVNGSIGLVEKLEWPALRRNQREDGELPDAIHVRFNDVSSSHFLSPDGTARIPLKDFEFPGHRGTIIRRTMIPVDVCFGTTAHKVQSLTVPKAVICLGPKLFAYGQAYVACSRVKSLKGLAICCLHPPKLMTRTDENGRKIGPADPAAVAELGRMRQHSILLLTKNSGGDADQDISGIDVIQELDQSSCTCSQNDQIDLGSQHGSKPSANSGDISDISDTDMDAEKSNTWDTAPPRPFSPHAGGSGENTSDAPIFPKDLLGEFFSIPSYDSHDVLATKRTAVNMVAELRETLAVSNQTRLRFRQALSRIDPASLYQQQDIAVFFQNFFGLGLRSEPFINYSSRPSTFLHSLLYVPDGEPVTDLSTFLEHDLMMKNQGFANRPYPLLGIHFGMLRNLNDEILCVPNPFINVSRMTQRVDREQNPVMSLTAVISYRHGHFTVYFKDSQGWLYHCGLENQVRRFDHLSEEIGRIHRLKTHDAINSSSVKYQDLMLSGALFIYA